MLGNSHRADTPARQHRGPERMGGRRGGGRGEGKGREGGGGGGGWGRGGRRLLEARMVNGQVINITELCRLASTAVRIASRLGLERVAKNVFAERAAVP